MSKFYDYNCQYFDYGNTAPTAYGAFCIKDEKTKTINQINCATCNIPDKYSHKANKTVICCGAMKCAYKDKYDFCTKNLIMINHKTKKCMDYAEEE